MPVHIHAMLVQSRRHECEMGTRIRPKKLRTLRSRCATSRSNMRVRTLVHLSDLHFGVSESNLARNTALAQALLRSDVDHVVVTGDVTQQGRWDEYEAFLETFGPLLDRGRMTVIPGNHDRPGDDIADTLTQGVRVRLHHRDNLALVLVDSTGPHNHMLFAGHGMLTPDDLAQIDDALDHVPDHSLVAVLMHHHPYPLPEEGVLEHLSSLVGLPYALELAQGGACLELLRGRCDLLLHGHRHVPRLKVDHTHPGRPLRIVNAGSSPELGSARMFSVADDGRLVGRPRWIRAMAGTWVPERRFMLLPRIEAFSDGPQAPPTTSIGRVRLQSALPHGVEAGGTRT